MRLIRSIAAWFPIEVWIGIGIGAAMLALYGGYKFQEARANRAVAEARQATATAGALDKVATETGNIRDDTQEKQRAVDEIQGSDTRLPDGYGSDLQRLRDKRDRDSR